MRYLGGKSRIRGQVAGYVQQYIQDGKNYVEPFVGGGWVLQEVISQKRFAYDFNEALVCMYQALQIGWIPPEFIGEDEYLQLKKANNPKDPLTAFAGFGCSFAGKWFGGYARSKDKECYASTTKRSLLKQLPKIQDVVFGHKSYLDLSPQDSVVYCDPPYAGTTSYSGTPKFDNDLFWDTMRRWSKDNTVIVSEYKAPSDFKCVLEVGSQMGLTKNGARHVAIERLFVYDGR